MKYSFIIPVYNEGEGLKELYQEISKLAISLQGAYEIIFIDDGSNDDSYFVLKELHDQDSQVVVLQLRQNEGKSVALQEGFSLAKGETIITLDADLQDDPSQIPLLIKKLNEGYDLVSGWKENRKDPFDKTLPSKLFNLIVRIFSGVNLHDFNSGLKVYRREVINELFLYGELHRFIPVIAANSGFKVTEIPVLHRSRKYGKSKYNWTRIPRGFLDFLTIIFLTKFGSQPLHFFGGIGVLMTTVGFLTGGYLSILRIMGNKIGDRPLLFLTILLITSGLQFIFTGLLAEMIYHLSPTKRLPLKRILRHERME